MRVRRPKPAIVATLVCAATAIALLTTPPAATVLLRTAVRDAVAPGQRLTLNWRSRFVVLSIPAGNNPDSTHSETQQHRQRLVQLERALRQSRSINLQLSRELETARQHGPEPGAGTRSEPLLIPELLRARVLSSYSSDTFAPSLVVDAGTRSRISAQAVVLNGAGTLLDQGTGKNVTVGQPVLAGRCVVGRISEAGRWTSLLQPITHADYSAPVRIARQTFRGPVYGAEGILKGTGRNLCRLEGVPYTEPVSTGDGVYTMPHADRPPLCFGHVVRATIQPGATWEIDVRPVVSIDGLIDVLVLRDYLNPRRIPPP